MQAYSIKNRISLFNKEKTKLHKLAVSSWLIENFIIVSSNTKEVYSSSLCLWKKITLKVVLLTLYQQLSINRFFLMICFFKIYKSVIILAVYSIRHCKFIRLQLHVYFWQQSELEQILVVQRSMLFSQQ